MPKYVPFGTQWLYAEALLLGELYGDFIWGHWILYTKVIIKQFFYSDSSLALLLKPIWNSVSEPDSQTFFFFPKTNAFIKLEGLISCSISNSEFEILNPFCTLVSFWGWWKRGCTSMVDRPHSPRECTEAPRKQKTSVLLQIPKTAAHQHRCLTKISLWRD